ELAEDVEGIAKTLSDLGVQVHRPMSLSPTTTEVKTLAWNAAVVPPLNLRDICLIVGDEIIETPPMLRSRYFETQFLAPIFNMYFSEGASWKPIGGASVIRHVLGGPGSGPALQRHRLERSAVGSSPCRGDRPSRGGAAGWP